MCATAAVRVNNAHNKGNKVYIYIARKKGRMYTIYMYTCKRVEFGRQCGTRRARIYTFAGNAGVRVQYRLSRYLRCR